MNPPLPALNPPLLDMRNVSVRREARLGLDNVTLRINDGEHLAILGPNGSGKSTLVKTITRELYPLLREGTFMSIMGRERWHVFALRAMLGIVSADLMTACTRDLTGREVALSGFFSSIGVPPSEAVEPWMVDRADEALERMDATYLCERTMTEMSSGEGRRVLLARSLVHRPKALLLDEPATALDLYAQHELREMMRKLATDGITLVLVTHQLSDIIPEIDRVVLMREGRIAADGPKADLLQSSILSDLFGLEVAVGEVGGYYHVWQERF